MHDTSVEFQVRPLGDHEYLVLVTSATGTAESQLRADPEVLDDLGVDGGDEELVVRETAAFLARHQSVIDLPAMIDLQDVAAAYDTYYDELRERLPAH